MLKHLVTATAFLTLAVGAIHAQNSTTVNFNSGDFQINDQNTAASNPLTGGGPADGNGAVLQLGYFTGANFTGTFVPLSGQGSANFGPVAGSNETQNMTSIGDETANFAGDGTFALQLTFTANDPASGNNLPAANTPLAIRFYNNTTIGPSGNSTFYNTVSSTAANWQWVAPGTPPSNISLSLNDPGLVWESIVRLGQSGASAFHTTIPVPEPSTLTLLGVTLIGAPVVYLRRRSKA